MKKQDLYLYGAGALILGALGFYFSTKNKANNVPVDVVPEITEETPPPPTADINLILQKGSKGLEVATLQKLMGIVADGVFGAQTEARLKALKGVTKTSLKQYKALPTINTNTLPINSKVMSNINAFTPTTLYLAKKKADGSFFSDYKDTIKVDYGKEIGVIKSKDGTGYWYVVLVEGLFSDDYYFVKSSEVKKI